MKVYLLMNPGEARDQVLECLFALGFAVLASVDPWTVNYETPFFLILVYNEISCIYCNNLV